MSILDLRGPEFLQTYVTLLAGAVIAGLVLRRLMRGPFDEHPSWTPKLGALQVAYLADGPGGACGAAIAGLAHRNVIRAGGSPARLALRAVRPNDLTPLEDAIYTAAGVVGGANVRDVRRAALPHAKSLADELERLEFIMPLGRRLFVRFAPAALMLALLVLGIAKVAVGISRGRPIEILLFLCGAALAGFIAFLCTSNHRTVRGERFLRSLRDDNAALESTATAAPERLHY